MMLSLVTALYLPLGYWFLSQLWVEQTTGYYVPIPFRPMVLYALLFAGFAILVILDHLRKPGRLFFWPRFIVITATIGLFLVTAIGAQIAIRQHINNDDTIHDGAFMTEVAGEKLLAGENPYAVDYRETAFGESNAFRDYPGHENPAWYYYIYLPFYTITSTVLQSAMQAFFGWYDARFILIPAFLLALWVFYRAPVRRDDKLLSMLFFSFNPIFIFFFISGYNDIFVFAWLFLSFFLVARGRMGWSAVAFGLALASKQSAWLAIPFYVAYVFFRTPASQHWTRRLWGAFRQLWPAWAVSAVFMVPFFLWSPADFWSDVVSYAGGQSAVLFPIYGNGLSVVLQQAGIVGSIWDPYPFWIFQVLFGIPALFLLLRWQLRNNTVSQMIISYTLFLLLFWFVSRFFNPNYVGFLSLLILAAWALQKRPSDELTA